MSEQCKVLYYNNNNLTYSLEFRISAFERGEYLIYKIVNICIINLGDPMAVISPSSQATIQVHFIVGFSLSGVNSQYNNNGQC